VHIAIAMGRTEVTELLTGDDKVKLAGASEREGLKAFLGDMGG